MLKYEAILLDPSPGEIAERLSDAAAAANKRCRTRLLADDPSKWRKFARQTQAAPDGFDLFRGGKGGVPGTQVVAAWWTDHIGRKHVVVRGRRIEHDESKVLLDKAALARRPPLWHCYPQYLYQRFLPTHAEWIAVCGCGAAGTPEALGWMGETCGPCHDRRQEGGDLRGNAVGWLHGVRNPFVAIAFSRDGTKVAAIEDGGPVRVWNLQGNHDVFDMAVTSLSGPFRATIFFAGELSEYLVTNILSSYGSSVSVFDLRKVGRDNLAWNTALVGVGVGDAIQVWPGKTSSEIVTADTAQCVVRNLSNGYVIRERDLYEPLFFHPSGNPQASAIAATGTERVQLIDPSTLLTVASLPFRSTTQAEHHIYQNHRIAYHEPTRTVFVARHTELEVYDLDRQQYTKVFRTADLPLERQAAIQALAISIDQRYLFMLAWDRLVVFDAGTLVAVAAFAWHLGPITALGVSPDGRTLATIGVEGVVKLWPIDRLIDSA